MFSFWFFMFVGALTFYLAMSPRINDGLIIKSGLILMAIGFFGAAGATYEDCDMFRPCMISVIGFFVVFGGVALRISSEKFKRITDWLHIEKPQPHIDRRVN